MFLCIQSSYGSGLVGQGRQILGASWWMPMTRQPRLRWREDFGTYRIDWPELVLDREKRLVAGYNRLIK